LFFDQYYIELTQNRKTYLYTYIQCIHITTNIKIINDEIEDNKNIRLIFDISDI